MTDIKRSVRDIVDFIYASGDLLPTFVTTNQMQEGIKIHQRVGNIYSDHLQEVFLKINGELGGYSYEIQGRIDLLAKDFTELIEVKSTGVIDEVDFESKHPNHFAQAKFYGYMLYKTGKINQSDVIQITVLYVHKYNFKEHRITMTYTFNELESFFVETLRQYIEFHQMIDRFKQAKLESIQTLPFPYTNFRKGQDKLVDVVQESIELRNDLFVNAPTGIGKSLGTLFPSLKALANKDEQIFYLTAKSTVKGVADEAVETLRKKSGLSCKSLVMTAKEKICLLDEVKCNPTDCPYARDFYQKLKGAVTDIYEHEDRFDEPTITRYAKKHELCPFEYQLTLSQYADIIIGDYNYVFDPRVYLSRFFDVSNPSIVLLIDEAHNLYDRVTAMFTIALTPTVIDQLLAEVETGQQAIEQSAARIIQKLNTYHQFCLNEGKDYVRLDDLDDALINEVSNLIKKLEAYFERLRDAGDEVSDELLTPYFELTNFIRISDYFNDDFIVWVEKLSEGVSYQISCLNPKELIKMRTKQVLSTIFFSATLHPIDYYKYLYGGEDSNHLLIDSPFEQERLDLMINANISTKYRDRSFTKGQIAEAIRVVVQNHGKYLVFFPSYQYLDLVESELYQQLWDANVQIIKQERGMGERARKAFIDQFDMSDKHIVGLAVLGGSFAEGIDLVGDRLNGVVVVGVGLPTFDAYRKELEAYFYRQGLNGYRYAFTYPGFNKILQAVGRVIRSEDDYGVALLIDTRYKSREYMSLFPPYWSHFRWVNHR